MSIEQHQRDVDPPETEHWSEGPVTTPERDPFYLPPEGFENAACGDLLRSRPVRIGVFGRVRQRLQAWQLLYRTQDLERHPRVGVTTVLLPAGARPDARRPLLSYQCAIDAVSGRSFPSYALRLGSHARGSVPQYEFLLVLHALRLGWAVSIPDHEGAEGHWGAPLEPGYCTLDAVRAAVSFDELGLDTSTPVGLWGYSGGGLASSWAAEAVDEHAPELDVVGAVLGSPVGDPASAFFRLNATRYAALPALVIEGLRLTYPDLDAVMQEFVNDEGLELLASTNKMTTMQAIIALRGFDLDRYATIPIADVMAKPEMVTIFEEIQPGRSAPEFPLLVLQATHDQIIAVDDVDGQVTRYRDAGASVQYIRDRTSEHITLLPLSVPLTLRWLDDRFAGRPTGEQSTTTVWSVAWSLRSAAGYLALAGSAARALVGLPISTRRSRR
ncbi:lipase [Rhodococcus sp. Leaf7]|uniref:lipase family protein n=1 Tax=unclassified Rhodococcus (in: high G+C Gram-positive bacteria) TaxID=192944 RepID=UPI0006F9C4DC|nr:MULTISPECIES: lipase family protein [unclassified Rhodococcus (in: high G+C Gram-positive bacteria)]KQU03105.1 lipase [Rhodococcus sp. Leaf7]KQU38906.1 lipase [Rhodococcus sp. Leaf247]